MKIIPLIVLACFYLPVRDTKPKSANVPKANSAVEVKNPIEYDEGNESYNFVIYGTYKECPEKVWIKMFVREFKKKDDKDKETNHFGPVKLTAAEKEGDAYSIIREEKEAKSGSFLSIVMCPAKDYRPDTHRYEFKVEFYEGEKLVGIHRENDKEWIPIQIK